MSNINNLNIENTVPKIINGWEYLTEIKPYEMINVQKLQGNYLENYNSAYKTFIDSLCISKENLDNIVNSNENNGTKYRFIIDTTDDNDIINKDDDFTIKFTKSKFINFKPKKIKNDLINYYKPMGFYVKGPLELNINRKVTKFYIELGWNRYKNEKTEISQNNTENQENQENIKN